MRKYEITYSQKAIEDLQILSEYIFHTCSAPQTARIYAQNIVDLINSLKNSAESYPLFNRRSFLKYGYNVRRINYKKMAIIYTIHGKTVLIHRIISGAVLSEM